MIRRIRQNVEQTLKLEVSIIVLLCTLIAFYGFPPWLLMLAWASFLFVVGRDWVFKHRDWRKTW
jgi:hypothetical protein